MTIDDLQPKALWQYFKALTQIPRPSYHEEAVRQYVLDEAARLGLDADMDEVGNVLVRKPASKGKENAPGVVLQSHLDMVPQKNNDKVHNFETDPIETLVDGEWLTANGTTLGADNGIGAAAALAVLADDSLVHGPIEALFTATEESGMDGAKGLRENWLQGDILLNLDSEDEGELYIGCAGGVDVTLNFPLKFESAAGKKAWLIRISGLAGGHSGLNIIDQRGNANVVLAQLLSGLSEEFDIAIAEFNGGNLRNAIPREAQAVIVFDGDQKSLEQAIKPLADMLRASFGKVDQGFSVSLSEHDSVVEALDGDSQKTLLSAVLLCPNGVLRMSHDMPGLVETSNNLAVVGIENGQLQLQSLLRSSSDDAKAHAKQQMAMLADALDGCAEFSGDYPGWQPDPSSQIVQLMQASGEEVFGKIPPLKAIHAGLECGILGEHYPHWQMISFGPTITGAHSPDEQVHIASVATFWTWLEKSLACIAEQ
ncbi:aminoacyl-histidine dipeptidase [Cardiobacteriaceae bacterium TAE3-ERU3]|nr:aminoacyl-histidine dipeptidase [Cardiobacteriaceae bacterium TAE3-ERU3]